MKKNVFTLLVVFTVMIGAASAQTESGSWLVGGNFELNTTKNDTRFAFSPSAGYFFIDNFAAGAIFDLTSSKVVDDKTTTFGVGPFARYYFGTSNVRPLMHAQYSYISRKDKDALGTDTYNGGNFFVAGGLAAFINRNVALEGLAGYSRSKFRHASEGSGGFRFKIGFQVYLSGAQMSKVTGQQ